MASSLALSGAPPDIFAALDGARQRVWDPCRPTEGTNDPVAPPAGDGDATAPPAWRAEGLSLRGLYGLACSLNPSEDELAPVQAWFEMAAWYPAELLLRDDVLTQLREAFRGVVRCPHFGAAIDRSVFESIVGRILGPEMEAWEAGLGKAAAEASPAALEAGLGADVWTGGLDGFEIGG